MSVQENCSGSRQSVDIGRFDLRMTIQAADPVVLIIDRNKQNVRLFCRAESLRGRGYERQQNNTENVAAEVDTLHQKTLRRRREEVITGQQPNLLTAFVQSG